MLFAYSTSGRKILGASGAGSGIRTDPSADSSLRLVAKRPQEKAINDRALVNKIEECGGGDTIE
jgi:hypothetical protein